MGVPLLSSLSGLYHRLPESVRYSLRPLNALDELSTHLAPDNRLAAQRFIGGARSITSLLRGRGRLVRLSGASAIDGGPLHALVDLGREGEAFWGSLLFAGRPARTVVAETSSPVEVLRAGAGRLDADIVLLRHHRFARHIAERAGFITLPTWVESFVDTRGSLKDVLARTARPRTLKSDLKKLDREGLHARLGSGADVATFLKELYEPVARERWGASYVSLPHSWMRQAPRFCQVLWIERQGERLGGALLEPRGRELRDVAVGMRDADDPCGIRAAQYYFAIQHAIDSGYERLNVGGSRPVLSDGVLRTKLKWGAVLTPILQWDYLALALPRGPEAARGFLAQHPLVAEMNGQLYAVVDPAASNGRAVSGMAGVIMPSTNGWAREVQHVPSAGPEPAVAG